MPTDLHELLERTASAPSVAPDPTAIRCRSRRRTLRTRVSAGVGTLALVAAAIVVWPGTPGLGPIDDVVDRPDATEDTPETGIVELDLPDGWTQVEIGGAALGVPPELEIVEVDASDTPPCANSGGRAFLARDTYPAASSDPTTSGDQPSRSRPEVVCNAGGNTAPQLIAAPRSIVPAWETPADSGWEPVLLGDLEGGRTLIAPSRRGPNGEGLSDDHLADRVERYRFPSVDLYLRFTTTDHDIGLIDQILATITPLDGSGDDAARVVTPPRPDTEGQPDPNDDRGSELDMTIEDDDPPPSDDTPEADSPGAPPEQRPDPTPTPDDSGGDAPQEPEDEPTPAEPVRGAPDDLLGRTFRSTSVTDGGTPRSLPHGPVEVTFEDRGATTTIRWFAGCNTTGGTFEIDADRLRSFDAYDGTGMECDAAGSELDAWLLEVFSAGPSWELLDDTLVITTATARLELVAG